MPIMLFHMVANYMILVVAMLTAVQFRFALEIGKPLGQEYQPHVLMVYLYLLGAVTIVYLGSSSLTGWRFVKSQLHVGRQFRLLLSALGISVIAILLLMPDISRLQMIYFALMAVIIGTFLILVPGQLRQNAHQDISILDNLHQIRQQRFLIQIWTNHRIRARYSQTLLGLLWIILFPILNSLVLAFAFSQLMGVATLNGVPWVLFLLSGQVIFTLFMQIVLNGIGAVQSMAGIIQQVYFPRELIIILLATEAIIDFLFGLAGFIAVATIYGITPNLYYLVLPIPILLMLFLAVGVSFIVGWLGLVIRDLQPLVSIGVQLLFYMTVLIDPSMANSKLRFLSLVNPVLGIVNAFRDVLIYNQMPDLASLFFPATCSIVLLYTGYVFFKVNEDRFTDYL